MRSSFFGEQKPARLEDGRGKTVTLRRQLSLADEIERLRIVLADQHQRRHCRLRQQAARSQIRRLDHCQSLGISHRRASWSS